MPGFMTMFRMWIFCLIVAREAISILLCFFAFVMVISFWMFHFKEGTGWMPRYVYGSFCVRVGKGIFLNWMCCAYMYALKVVGLKLNLFGHPVIMHLERLRSRFAHFENF